MCNKTSVSLGFTNEKVPVGTHMCLVFTNDEERINALLKFLLSGLRGNERCTCFTENLTEDNLRDFFKKNNISYDEKKENKSISLSGTNDIYFPQGSFVPEKMLNLLTEFYTDSIDMAFNNCRVIGEMEPIIETIPGGERLLEYESKVTLLVREYPITVICQYNANKFNGATIMDVLKVHPLMIVDGAVLQNPFFIEPEVYLNSI